MKQKILILPCAGDSNVGCLTLLAARKLTRDGRATLVDEKKLNFSLNKQKSIVEHLPFVVVDGCEKRCARKRLEETGHDFEFHLSLDDLGIEKTEGKKVLEEDLQLTCDAIIAESTRLSETPPKILGTCGCR